ncbi:MAG: hypothetical protein LBV43_02480 [Prevotella sp.]|jgi:outer membrane murein-binding lipoprotein Lpp|nr:hypothetical protein [Prevotella sp.]
MNTKRKFHFLTLAIIITVLLLAGCIAGLIFSSTLNTFTLYCTIASILIVMFCTEIFLWICLTHKKDKRQHVITLHHCKKVESCLKNLLKAQAIWVAYFDFLSIKK